VPSDSPVMRLVRLMTHLNIGAMLGMAAWLIWPGWQVTRGQLVPPRPEPQAHSQAEPMRLVPVSSATGAACHSLPQATTAPQGPGGLVPGAEL
jgi:hypothetical protein